jgi:membrane protein
VLAIEPMGTLLEWAGRLIPYLMISLAFAFIYVFVPNTRVRLTSAMIGALVAGFLWQSVGWLFAHFMVSSTRYTAIYSGLAILILFMIWVYIAWLILLIGASIAFYHQHPEYLTIRSRDLRLSNRLRERLALLVAGHVARAYETGAPAWTNEALAAALGVPKPNTERMLYMLQEQGFITGTAADPPRFMPARAPESIRVKDLLNAVRCFEEHDSGCKGTAPDPVIDDIEHHIDAAIEEALTGVSLKDLADRLQPPGPAVLVDRQADPRGLPDDRALSSEAELSPRIAERD